MKNKQINKILFMFIIGLSLLFSCSSAEIVANTRYTIYFKDFITQVDTSFSVDSDFVETCYNFFIEPKDYESDFSTAMSNLLKTVGKSNFYISNDRTSVTSNVGVINILLYDDDDWGYHLASGTLGSTNIISYVYEGKTVYYLRFSSSDSNVTVKSLTANISYNFYKGVSLYNYIYYSSADIKNYNASSEIWDGVTILPSNFTLSNSEGSSLTDDNIANAISIFLSSEDLATNRPSGYDDYYVIYNSLVDQYYIYLYKSSLNLAMRYGDFDDEGKFDFNDLSSGEGFKIFRHELDGDLKFIEDLWATICEYFSTTKYYLFRVNPVVNKCHFIDSYSDNALVYTGSMEHIVYSTKDITLLVGSGLSGTVVDTDNSIMSGTLINSSTNEEYEFTMPETSVSDTPWNRFISIIQSIPDKIKSALSEMTGLTKIITIISPIGSAILIILNVLLSSISLLSRAVMFVYTLPTIKASDALFLVDVDSTTGLVFAGNSWGTKFLEGLNMVKEFSWNGLNLWTLFTSFIVAIFAIHCIKLVRKHYHY